MPQYIYINDETNEYVEVIQTMSENHKYFGEDGKEWRRVFTVPNASIDSLAQSDPFDLNSLTKKTGEMKGTMGDLFATSAEMSERRAEHLGHEDPVKRNHFNKYERENGIKHFEDKQTVFEDKNVKIDMNAAPTKIDFGKKE